MKPARVPPPISTTVLVVRATFTAELMRQTMHFQGSTLVDAAPPKGVGKPSPPAVRNPKNRRKRHSDV